VTATTTTRTTSTAGTPGTPGALPAARAEVGHRPPNWLHRLNRLTDPGRIRALTAAAITVPVALCAVLVALFGSISSGIGLIGNQAAPEVTASTSLYFHLNDMDAQVANVLLAGNATGLGLSRQQAQAIYASDQGQADQALEQAAVVAGRNPSAQRSVRAVLDGVGEYEALAAEAMYLDAQDSAPPGRPPAAALVLYRQATDEMRTSILPAARSLTNANATALSSAYQGTHGTAQAGVLWTVLLGVLALAALIALQIYLSFGHRRLVSLPLATASVVVLVLTIVAATTLSGEATQLRVAKVEAFDSILALSQARAVSYDANADESRFLVDPGRAAFYQQGFLTKSDQIADLPGVGIFHYDAALARAIDAYRANNADIRFGGYIGAEFRNITFTGERAATWKTLLAYQVYERDDRRIRALNAAGNLRTAIEFDTSYAAGSSNWAFAQYDNALVSVIDINQRAFSQAIQAGQQGVSGWTGVIPLGSAVLMVLLVLVGVRPRLAEYHP
jgi:hypothetical protein